jgi:pSer/pThr/pTyr-binding forkhead associated (FHA) protein
MIFCPECQAQQLIGSIYCLECGGYLHVVDDKEVLTNDNISAQQSHLNSGTSGTSKKPSGETKLTLIILETQDTIYLSGKDIYTLGRFSEGQSILPDVDLSLYQAYEKGVSRLHAAVRSSSNEIVISDLGSVNGTRLNGVKIMPAKTYPLHNQDILELGKLKLRVVINTSKG